MPMDAYIVDCVRTAGGKRKGVLSKWHPADLGASVVDEVVRRSGVPPAAVEDVIVGCGTKLGAQAGNIGRNIVLSSKVLPESVPGSTVDRACGSSQQALHFAAQAVMSGTQDVVIAAGVEVMSLVPIGTHVTDCVSRGHPTNESIGFQTRYAHHGTGDSPVDPTQFAGAEMLVSKYALTREALDSFGVASHAKAQAATANGHFKKEILVVEGHDKKLDVRVSVTADEGIRAGTTYEKLAGLKPLAEGGNITAATSSQITDGASAVMICNERAVKKYGLKPRARIHALGLAGSDPVIMLEGPIPATKSVLAKAGMTIDDIDMYEVNEAFASVPMAWAKALGADPKKLNVSGGAIALGHALGSTGTRCMTTLVNGLERTGGRFGVVAICQRGGTANATIIERVSEVRQAKL